MSKYEIGQEIPVGGIITITGLAHNKNGNPVYNTDRGVVVPELLIERLEMKPLEKAKPEQPKQEPEKAEPEYLNMRVVCVESNDDSFTVGKLYEFKEGFLDDNQGITRPHYSAKERIKSLSDEYLRHWPYKFIEFKGE